MALIGLEVDMQWMVLAASLALSQESEEECKKAIDAFHAAFKGDEQARIVAINGLAKHKCEKSVAALAPIVTGETEKVRIAAAKALGGFDDPKAVDAVAQAVIPNIKSHEVVEALARALEELNWEVGATVLNPLLSKHDDKTILEELHVIIPMLGKLGSASSVDPLIKLLEHAENEARGGRVRGVRSRGNQKLAALEGPIRKALEEITGGVETSHKAWQAWWGQNSERLSAGATLIYRCKATGKRWDEKAGREPKCPYHDKPEKDGVLVSTRLVESKGKKP